MTTKERFMSKVNVGDTAGCWTWAASTYKDGYGCFSFNGKVTGAHRASYAMFKGDPAGKYVLHRCDNPPCVNPDHLFLGTHQDNVTDMISKGRQAIQPQKTHCVNGHEFTPENIYYNKTNKKRACLTCHNASALRSKHKCKNAKESPHKLQGESKP